MLVHEDLLRVGGSLPGCDGRIDRLEGVRGAGRAPRLLKGHHAERIERLNRQFQVGLNANLKLGVSLDEGARQTTEAVGRVAMPDGYKFKFFGQVKVLDETTAESTSARAWK